MLPDVYQSGFIRKIQRERCLPLIGEVVVNEGQQVQATDVVARAELLDKILLVDLVNSLGINLDDIESCLVRQPGEMLLEDDVIAWVGGTIPRLVRTPISGKFVSLHQGSAVLEAGTDFLEVYAGMEGVVETIIPGYCVVLASSGLLMQGVWGNGLVSEGPLRVLPLSWYEPLEKSLITSINPGEIIAIGRFGEPGALEQLMAQKPSGLIMTTIKPRLIPQCKGLNIPVLVLQGFGDWEPDPWILENLQPLDGKIASVNTEMGGRLSGQRAEVIVPLDRDEMDEALDIKTKLTFGQQVRVLSGTQAGKLGEITELVDKPYLFESGIELLAATVKLANGEEVTVPLQNLIIVRSHAN